MGTIVTEANHGGGLHGRIAIELKQAFFEKVKDSLNELGRPELAQDLQYHQLFTLSAGTSFGGLSTVGLSPIGGRDPYFSSPGEIGGLIDAEAGNIFPHRSTFLGKLFNNPRQIPGGLFGTTQYSNKRLKEIVQDVTGTTARMSDVENDIMITMTKLHPEVDALFAKSHVARGERTLLDDGTEADRKNWLLWEATLGGASPTTYFQGVPLTNPARDDNVVVVDGGQSGWNDPSGPAFIESVFLYGKESNDLSVCEVIDHRSQKGLMMPHNRIHIHWGTGDFNPGVDRDDAIKNTLASVGGAIVSSSMQSVHRFSMMVGQAGIIGTGHYYSFDQMIDTVPSAIRPDGDFTLSTPDQLARLRDTGQLAADRLSGQIEEVAKLVAEAYIERKDFEASNPGQSYKDHLRPDTLSV